MEEQNVGDVQYNGTGNIGNANTIGGTTATAGNLPQEVSVWSRIKAFLLQDVNRDVVVTMTPYQAKVLKEVHDFWCQEITFGKVKDFLFQEITFGSKNK